MSELADVKEGDLLVYDSNHTGISLVRVTRVTSTQIIVDQSKFRKTNGYMVGGDAWTTSLVRFPEDGEVELIRNKRAIQQLKMRFFEFNIGELRDWPNEKVAALAKKCQELFKNLPQKEKKS